MATPQPNTAPHLQCQKQAAEAPLQSPEQRWQLSVCRRMPPGEIGFSVSTPVVTSMTSRGSDFQKPEWQWHLLGQQGSEESFSRWSHTSHTHTHVHVPLQPGVQIGRGTNKRECPWSSSTCTRPPCLPHMLGIFVLRVHKRFAVHAKCMLKGMRLACKLCLITASFSGWFPSVARVQPHGCLHFRQWGQLAALKPAAGVQGCIRMCFSGWQLVA